jgi:nucleoside-diphosphate kinase
MHQQVQTEPCQTEARSLVIIKPDAFKRRLVGAIISRFERFGIETIEHSLMTREFWKRHYRDHIHKDFYQGLEDFMVSGYVLALAVHGDVNEIRKVALQIRQDCGTNGPENLVHASDSPEAAERELRLWFRGEDETIRPPG